MIYIVSCYGGALFRMLIKDCNGEPVTADDVTAITYSVYRESITRLQPVPGHQSIQVPDACIRNVTTEACTGEAFNFEHRISARETPPFPEIYQKYRVVYTFTDTAGEPHPCEVICYTGTK